MKRIILQLTATLLLGACTPNQSDIDNQAQKTANEFLLAYFNFNFKKASKLSTPESEKWLQYAASNVTQAAVDLYNAQELSTSTEIDDFYWTDDSTATVCVKVNGFVADDSIKPTPCITDEGLFSVTVVRRNSKMLVRMAGPLRSEKRSHD